VLVRAARRQSTLPNIEQAGSVFIHTIRGGRYTPVSVGSVLPEWSWYSKKEQPQITAEGEGREQLVDWAMGRLSDLLYRDSSQGNETSAVQKQALGAKPTEDVRDAAPTFEAKQGVLAVQAQYFPFNESLGDEHAALKDVALVKASTEPTGFRQKTLNNHDYMERWSRLSKKALKKATKFRGETLGETVCFVEVNSTDTHVAVWRDKIHKRVVVSFRGTDINWKDFLTDLMCFQTDVSWLFQQDVSHAHTHHETKEEEIEPNFKVGAGLDPSGLGNFVNENNEKSPKAHIGFCIAYASVREQLLEVIRQLVPEDEKEEWTIYTTGHSLGAALATFLAVDVTLKLEGVNVVQYNFGSAKMGDEEFARRYNKLVPNTFRMVNDADVIVRLPRNQGVGSIPGIGTYCHVGRTVLTSPECALWIEGESPGEDPLRERWEQLSDLLDAEVKLMRTVVDGKSFRDHVENGYYNGMLSLWDRSVPEDH